VNEGIEYTMLNSRHRPLVLALAALVGIWLLAWGGFALARNSKMTAEKVKTYLQGADLSRLSAAERARSLRELASRLNALSAEDRRQARMDAAWRRLFEQMTDEEKAAFLEATLPAGIKQMLTAFEQLPEEKRKQTVEDALKRLEAARTSVADSEPGSGGPAPVSEEVRRKLTTLGLKTFYSQSSAQTKAELAPVLEEIQRTMESGRSFHPRRSPHE
jgi:hypothetical protein